MTGWKQVRSAVVGGAAVAVAWAVVALAAPAQPRLPPPEMFPVTPVAPPAVPPPAKLDFYPQPPAAEPKPEERLPKLDFSSIQDDKVEPAGAKLPAGTPARPVAGAAGRPGADVPDPPHPVVTIRVRVPADTPPGDDLKYIIPVQNVTAAEAPGDTVRTPVGVGVESVVMAVREPDNPDPNEKKRQVVWTIGTLKAGAVKTIELTLRHKPNVTELKNLAYVKYEHGQSVTTKIAKPTVKVSKTAPKQTVRDEPFTVRLLIENTGKTPAEGVRVVENLPTSAEVEPITAGAKRDDANRGPAVWFWEIAKLQPGERKTIEYRVTPREAKDVFTTTSVGGHRLVADKPTEARTQVLVPGLEVKLTGPTGVVNAGEHAASTKSAFATPGRSRVRT